MYNALTLKYQLDNVSVPERVFTQLYVICCFDAHISRPVIDDHEMEKSYQTGDLFLEFGKLDCMNIGDYVKVICNEDCSWGIS